MENPRKRPTHKLLRIIENENRGKRFLCEHAFPELTAVCPRTGLPDFYTARVVYEPGDALIELKSLKQYLTGYRNVGIHHEELTNQILEDFANAVDPRWIFLELSVNVRGGISTTVTRYWDKESGDNIEKAIEGLRRATKEPE